MRISCLKNYWPDSVITDVIASVAGKRSYLYLLTGLIICLEICIATRTLAGDIHNDW